MSCPRPTAIGRAARGRRRGICAGEVVDAASERRCLFTADETRAAWASSRRAVKKSGPMHHRSLAVLPLILSAAALRVPHSQPRNLPPQLCASEDAAKKRLTANAPPPTAPCGCCPQNHLTSRQHPTLTAYDEGHRRTAAQPERGPRRRAQRERVGGRAAGRALQTSIRALLDAAAPADGRIMLGFCADDAAAAWRRSRRG